MRSTTGSRRLFLFLLVRCWVSGGHLPLDEHPDIIRQVAEHVPRFVLGDRPLQSARENFLRVQNELPGQGASSDRPTVVPSGSLFRVSRQCVFLDVVYGRFHLSVGRGVEPQPSHRCAAVEAAENTRAPKRRSRWRETERTYRRWRHAVGL